MNLKELFCNLIFTNVDSSQKKNQPIFLKDSDFFSAESVLKFANKDFCNLVRKKSVWGSFGDVLIWRLAADQNELVRWEENITNWRQVNYCLLLNEHNAPYYLCRQPKSLKVNLFLFNRGLLFGIKSLWMDYFLVRVGLIRPILV